MTGVVLSPLRTGRVTASRVASILGLSRYRSATDTMREMVRQHYGLDPEWNGNYITRMGQELEPRIRAAYTRQTGRPIALAPFIVHPTIDWLGATPDGMVDDDGLVELKLIGRQYVHYSQRPDYEVQCRLQLAVTRRKWCDLVMFHKPDPDEPDQHPWVSRVTPVQPDWLESVMPKLTEFHDRFLELTAPPEPDEQWLTPADVGRTDEEWQQAALDWADRKADLEDAQAALEAASARLSELADGHSARGCGVSVSVVERTGSVDWKGIAERFAPNVDVSEFRRPSSIVTSVRGVK